MSRRDPHKSPWRDPDPLEEALEEHAADLAAALQRLIDPGRHRPPTQRRHWWEATTWKAQRRDA